MIRCSLRSDGYWHLEAHGYVDGVYRAERVDQVTRLGQTVEDLRWFFYTKYAGHGRPDTG